MRFLLLSAICVGASITIPMGLDRYIPAPDDNPMSADSIALGKRLFFDRRLSRDRTIACSTCHDPQRAFSDTRPRAVGIAGKKGSRRTPRIANRAWGKSFFWDGRAKSLEEQVLGPIANSLEMDLEPEVAASRVGLSKGEMQRALASYLRSILSGDSPYDRYLAGDEGALSLRQRTGLELFRGKAGCASCHLGPNLTDEEFHVTGVGGGADAGRFAITGVEAERSAFKTPSLRDAARTPPYMHDGSMASLADVIRFYNEGGNRRVPGLDGELQPLGLSVEEQVALGAFLEALNGKIRDGL